MYIVATALHLCDVYACVNLLLLWCCVPVTTLGSGGVHVTPGQPPLRLAVYGTLVRILIVLILVTAALMSCGNDASRLLLLRVK